MAWSLYDRVVELEAYDTPGERLPHVMDVLAAQGGVIMRDYGQNPIVTQAVDGERAIESSLREIDEINRGFGRILPWRKDAQHNSRVDQIEEVVGGVGHLRALGRFYPDNLVNVVGYVGLISFGSANFLSSYFGLNPDMGTDLEKIERLMFANNVFLYI